MDSPYLSVVVPCYNESDCVKELHRRLEAVCDGLFKPYEIVYVNDGSSDNTWRDICRLPTHGHATIVVNLSRNFGQQAALMAGLSEARADRILIVDADLQDPPELLPAMLELMDDSEADVVYGKRRSREGESAWKRITAAVFYRLFNRLAEVAIPNDTGDFRLINRRALNAFLSLPERRRFTRGLVSWVGFRQVAIEFDRDPRFSGVTKWPSIKMLGLALDAIVSFSTKPLRLGLLCFLVAALLGAVLGVFAIRDWSVGDGSALIVAIGAVVAFLQAANFLVLSIFGEYLGRIHEHVQGRPTYIVRETRRAGSSMKELPLDLEVDHVA